MKCAKRECPNSTDGESNYCDEHQFFASSINRGFGNTAGEDESDSYDSGWEDGSKGCSESVTGTDSDSGDTDDDGDDGDDESSTYYN
jgi:hypothetical protein